MKKIFALLVLASLSLTSVSVFANATSAQEKKCCSKSGAKDKKCESKTDKKTTESKDKAETK